MYTKLYDLHFECGAEQGIEFARNVLGNNAIEFKQYAPNFGDAIIMCVSEMSANGAFQSLNRDPSLSVYPIFAHTNNFMISTHGHGHSHSHNVPATPAIQVFFELHIECGIESGGRHHAETILITSPPSGITVYHDSQKFLDDAICEVARKLDDATLFDQLLRNPLMSVYPLPNGSGTTSASASASSHSSSAKKKDIERMLPNSIGRDTVYPACQEICTSYDHFRDTKCRSICEWRF